jgi:hypothetical protein
VAAVGLAAMGTSPPAWAKGYPLDDLERSIAPRGPVRCPKVELAVYRGTHLRYRAPAKIFVGFKPHLEKMEQLVNELATRHYGRPPRRLVHLGTYNCRRIGAYPDWLSEHGLGNAIDVAGFDFGRLAKGAVLPDGVPRQLRHPFRVRVDHHWKRKTGLMAHHARFLHALAQKLIARRDIFRVLLGPSYPGHHNHFHFDMAPYRLVDIFGDDRDRG